MTTASPSAPARLPGDASRRRARNALLLFVVALPLSIWLFGAAEVLWTGIMPLEGATFMGAATAFGAALALAPLLCLIGFLVALWCGVESVYQARDKRTPALDKLIVGLGFLIWFLPAVATLATIVDALLKGRVHFPSPSRDYFLATDPIPYWQGIGFLILATGLFAFLAWRYWRPKLQRKG